MRSCCTTLSSKPLLKTSGTTEKDMCSQGGGGPFSGTFSGTFSNQFPKKLNRYREQNQTYAAFIIINIFVF